MSQAQTAHASPPARRAVAAPQAARATPVFSPPQQQEAAAHNFLTRDSCPCGGGCPRCQGNHPLIQPKLTIGPVNDAYEREADQIASAVTATATPPPFTSAPRAGSAATPRVQRQINRTPAATSSATDATARGPGRPLDATHRGFFESRLGHDLGPVRVHTDSASAQSAERLGARAYTQGCNVVFNSGEYAPSTSQGRHLLAHELVHVVQQGAAPKQARTANSPAPPSLAPAAYSLRLVGEQGTRRIGPPTPEVVGDPGATLQPAGPAPAPAHPSATPPLAADKGPEENVPLQRLPKNGDASEIRIQRTAKFTQPKPLPRDPLARLVQDLSPGLTTPMLNGAKAATSGQLLAAATPTNVRSTGISGGQTTCKFDNFNIETSAEEIVASAAPAGGWTAKVPPDKLGSPAACAKVAQVPVTMNALPSNAHFVKNVLASEEEHVADLKELHNRHFVPLDSFINGLTSSGPNLQTCANDLGTKLNHRHTQAAYAFSKGWAASVEKLDGAVGTHTDNAVVATAKDCSSATITVSQANPTIAGSAPGNVKTIAPTVTKFTPASLKVVGNNVQDGKTVVKAFSSAANAAAALAVIQHYGLTSRNVIGPLEFFLAGAAAPKGPLKGASELAIDPTRYQVTLDIPGAGDWAITDVMGKAGGVNVNVIANFGAKRDEAFSGWASLKGFNFTQQCWVGGTRQAPEMMYFRI